MKPQLLALITAMAWGIGGYFEKKGLHMGNLSPQMGITIRTAVALLILGAISFPQWKTVGQAGTKALLMMVIGGGVVAGSLGMLCYYAALKGAPLTQVMPIAFTSPGCCGRFLRDALLLCSPERRTPHSGHADCFHFSPLWRADGSDAGR
jgi:bacterial/archaeal transporter family protein